MSTPPSEPIQTPDDLRESLANAEIPARVLFVSANPLRGQRYEAALASRCIAWHTARSVDEALGVFAASGANLLLIDRHLDEQDGLALAARALDTDPRAVPVLLCDDPTLDDAVLAMRHGVADLLGHEMTDCEIRRRVAVAAERAESLRRREDRIERLKNLCGTLDDARNQLTGQVGDLCSDLLGAYQTLADQIGDVSLTSELNSLLRQELDVESLLRTTLEYLLNKLGSTNAAVFLPSNHGEFTLGAYINYNGPRESAEVLLDDLAYTFAPKFQDEADPLVFRGEDDLRAILGDTAGWMGDSEVIVVSCIEDSECLAVLTVFRPCSKPFTPEQRHMFELVSRLFSAQLGRVVRVHHRHLPEDDWGDESYSEDNAPTWCPDWGTDWQPPVESEWSEDEDDDRMAA